jgi:hypothetical protein
MTIESASPLPGSPAVRLLLTPGPRLGWTFRDRTALCAPFEEPPPDPEAISEHAAARLADAQRSWQQAVKWALRPSLIIAVGLLALAGCAHAINPSTTAAPELIAALILAAPGLAWTGFHLFLLNQAKEADPQRHYQVAYDQWAQRAEDWQQAELTRLAGTPEWHSAASPARRTDIFGGTLTGWQALLAVHGASITSESPLLVADLSGQHPAEGLAALARQAGIQVAEYFLPRDLDRSGLLARLSPAQLATALAEAIHAGTPGGARADRAVDVRVLQQLCSALASGGITPARLAAATEVALGSPEPSGLLTPAEADLIRGSLFSDSYKTQIAPNLVRLDAFLSELAAHAGTGTPVAPDPAYCTFLIAEPAARSAQAELLAALIIEWLTVQVTAHTASAPAVIIAAADQITRPHLERLAEACEHRGVPLTLLFRHLRDDALGMIGGGATAFMRLGNHHEAEQAAIFIGRQHSFVLSGYTATRGTDHTTTRGQSETWTTGESRGRSSTRGWAEELLSSSVSGSHTSSREHSETHGWGIEYSESDSTSSSQADTTQRVYEYAVEPTVLQDLPDNALLLTHRGSTGSQLQAIECDPAIITMPDASFTLADQCSPALKMSMMATL